MTDDRPAMLLRAFACGATGNLVEAERLLGDVPDDTRSIQELDLLARIAVHRGDDQRAASLWRGVLVTDPQNESARAALARLRSPWKSHRLLRHAGVLMMLGGLLGAALLVATLALMAHWRQSPRTAPDTADNATQGAHLQVPDATPLRAAGWTLEEPRPGVLSAAMGLDALTSARFMALADFVRACSNSPLVVIQTPAVDPANMPLRWTAIRRANVLVECLRDASGLPPTVFAISSGSHTNSTLLAVRLITYPR